MLKHAHRSISEINSATERIAALRDPDSGTVRLAFLHSLANWLVPDLLRRFRSAAPRVQFTLSQAAAYEMVGFLARGHVDLAITAPGLTEPGLDGTSCRSSACASWFRAITALPSAPDCASPKPPTKPFIALGEEFAMRCRYPRSKRSRVTRTAWPASRS
jgi:DNA-binding transcriptional LysR family regulator